MWYLIRSMMRTKKNVEAEAPDNLTEYFSMKVMIVLSREYSFPEKFRKMMVMNYF